MDKRLDRRKILLGVTGSIAAYKACEVLRLFQREGADVRVVMTGSAKKFVCPLTFETLSNYEVISDLFPEYRSLKTEHITLAEWADTVLVCPATANIIGKIASGIADDFLSTVILASRSPVLFAPAMDRQMVQNPVYISNVEKLKKLGYRFIEPETGHLASGLEGPGRLAGMKQILDKVLSCQISEGCLTGKKVLITAGPTQEWIDPVRYITNPSSGKMGYALAEAAVLRGAEVTLISGPTNLEAFSSVRLMPVNTVREMAEAVYREWPSRQVLIMAAAVSDYRPIKTSSQKIKKQDSRWQLDLEKTEDILASLVSKKKHGLIVGFALETENGFDNAVQKLKDKQLDLVCLNVLEKGAGFGKETNKVTLIDKDEQTEELPLLSKRKTAEKILDKIEKLLQA